MNFLSSILFLSLSFNLMAAWKTPDLCTQKLGTLPIQQNGRVKPLLVHASQVIKSLTGSTHFDDHSPTELYCGLSLQAYGQDKTLELTTPVEHIKTKNFLKLSDATKTISFSQLVGLRRELRLEYQRQKYNDAYKKELGRLITRIDLYQDLISGQNWKIYQSGDWLSLTDVFEAQAVRENSPLLIISLQKSELSYQAQHNKTYQLEYRYFKWQPYRYSMLLVLLALFCLLALRPSIPGLLCTGLVLAVQTLAIAVRVTISGRAPITNMYETVLFSGYGALGLACLLYFFSRKRLYLNVGLAYNFCCLMMMNFADGMLDPHISPLVPVLRDNFWLSTHVTTVVLSYAAFALSWLLSNYVMGKQRFGLLSSQDLKLYTELIYNCLKYGVVLLSAGLILGGVWADYSWGRFWGWDPKETWALIVLLVYMAILHGKYTAWIPPKTFVPLVAGAFLSVMMAWFGVNYILAAGLHSYGFSEGGALFLGSFFALQIIYLLLTQLNLSAKTLR